MLDIEPKKVMVCVDSQKGFEAALEFAVAEAHRRECGVHVVFALPPLWIGAPGDDIRIMDGELRKAGTDILLEAERGVRELSGSTVSVSSEIIHGPVVPSLVDDSRNAGLVVLQHHRMHRPHHLPTKSVTNGVAARAHAPVVAVPDDWHETESHPAVIAVGVEDAISSRKVAEAAFEQARRIGAEVHLVRAWLFSAAFDAEVFSGEAGRRQNEQVREEVQRGFARLARGFPDVEHRVVAMHGQTSDVLVAKSELSRMLVVGRHDPVVPLGSHLGPNTRTVLNHSACPVLVVDPRP